MSRAAFTELMEHARKHGYAVGYFESWNMESLLAAADAAEKLRSPVILGFSGIYLPHPERVVHDRLSDYAALGAEICRRLRVPCCFLFNESDNREWVESAIDLGFDLVMFTDETLDLDSQTRQVAEITEQAHQRDVAVEGEMTPLPGAGGEYVSDRAVRTKEGAAEHAERAAAFTNATGIDALAPDLGQVHIHGRRLLDLDLLRLKQLRERVPVPLVLHGASSVAPESIRAAISGGIRKINVGSSLKRVYFEALRRACNAAGEDYSPYEVVGTLNRGDVHVEARLALQHKIEELMHLFGSAGMAF